MIEEHDRRRPDAIGLDQVLADAASSDKPSMGDPEFVEGKLRELGTELADTRKAYNASTSPKAHVEAADAANEAVKRSSADLAASNTAYQQTISAEGQQIFVAQRGYENLEAVLHEFADRALAAIIRLENEVIDDDQFQFEIDAAVEDTQALVMGLDRREPDPEAEAA
jgi:hypothetical protein